MGRKKRQCSSEEHDESKNLVEELGLGNYVHQNSGGNSNQYVSMCILCLEFASRSLFTAELEVVAEVERKWEHATTSIPLRHLLARSSL